MAETGKNRRRGFSHCMFAFACSLKGIWVCCRDEVAFRQECIIGVPHFMLLLFLPLESWVRVYLGALWILLLVVELLNTAIEAIVDLASPEWHVLAKKAKDCGSAAVFLVLLLMATSWGFVFYRMISK